MIYLDNAATTRPIVAVDEVNELLEETGINPSNIVFPLWLNSHSSYSRGDYLLWICREKISKIINCDPNEIIFTSGGCEGNSMVIDTLYNLLQRPVLVNKNEHRSVLNNPRIIQSNNYEWTMLVNNETGEKFNTYGCLGSDMVQGLCKEKIDVSGLLCATFSGHKIHANKGVGFVYMNKELQKYCEPLIYGGAQEFGIRGGTSNVEGCLNMTARVMYCDKHLEEHRDKIATMKKLLIENLPNGCVVNHVNDSNIISIRTPLSGEYIVNRLAEKEIYISTGSACSTGEPSYVLKNLGLTDDECNSTIRVSLDAEENCEDDIKTFLREIGGILNE